MSSIGNDLTFPEGALQCLVTIVNKRGLHARAAAKFVQMTETFDARVGVSRNGQLVSGRSIMGLMMLAAAPGTTIDITADGTQAGEVMAALKILVEAGFDEED